MNTGSVTNTESSNFLMMTSLTMSTSYRPGWSLMLRCVVTVLTDVSECLHIQVEVVFLDCLTLNMKCRNVGSHPITQRIPAHNFTSCRLRHRTTWHSGHVRRSFVWHRTCLRITLCLTAGRRRFRRIYDMTSQTSLLWLT